jgi:sulfite dehydrogenase
VKALSEITVLSKPFEGFWVKKAYRIPDNPCGCVPPGTEPKKTVPINRMTTRSLIVDPVVKAEFRVDQPVEITGIAFSGGYGIKNVVVSVDGGKNWADAKLGEERGKYSWTQWSYAWRPAKSGEYALMAKATNSIGESQPFEGLWNTAGYLWNKIEKTEVVVR